MNVEQLERKEKLRLVQKFFFKSFLLSFIFLFITSLICIFFNDAQVSLITKLFDVSKENANLVILLVLSFWKILIFQFALVPAIVIWCIRRCGC